MIMAGSQANWGINATNLGLLHGRPQPTAYLPNGTVDTKFNKKVSNLASYMTYAEKIITPSAACMRKELAQTHDGNEAHRTISTSLKGLANVRTRLASSPSLSRARRPTDPKP